MAEHSRLLMQQLADFWAVRAVQIWPDGTPFTPDDVEMFEEEARAREIERGERLPDDAACSTCRWVRVRKVASRADPDYEVTHYFCCIRSVPGSFPPRLADDFCGEWRRRPADA